MMKLIVLFFLLAASYSSAAQPTQSSTSSGQSIYVMSFNIRSDTGGEADGTNGWYYRQKAVMKMFNEKHNITVIMVTHDKETAHKVSHKTILLSDGEIIKISSNRNQ